MINDPLYQRWREAGWRRKLTPAEEAELRTWLAAHPEAKADWEKEGELNEVLRRLPDPAVPSNFTARVMQAVELETAAQTRASGHRGLLWPWRRLRWLPRAAILVLVLAGGMFSCYEAQSARRQELARSVAVVASVTSLPDPQALEDFDAIYALRPAPAADEELLVLLQ